MPTIADIEPIAAMLDHLALGEPVRHDALTVIPLLTDKDDEPDWLTLLELGDVVTITEVGEEGVVPTLSVTNAAGHCLLLLDGEELVGAKQNRILNTTVLVNAHATVSIPVSCVEQGRWAWRSRHFTSSDASLFASLRAKKAGQITQSLRRSAGHASDQGAIWNDLGERAAAYRVESPTGAMRDMYVRHEDAVAAARAALAAQPRQVGALVYVAGRWLGLDLLASPGLFDRAWPRLCAGYAADGIGRKASRRLTPAPEAVMPLVRAAAVERAPAVGLGLEFRMESEAVTGAALVAEGRVAHFMAFTVCDR
jgi:hypothetical protein